MSLEATPRVLAVLDEHNSRSILFRLPAELLHKRAAPFVARACWQQCHVWGRQSVSKVLDLATRQPDFPCKVRFLRMLPDGQDRPFLPSDLPAFASFAGRLTNLDSIRISGYATILDALLAALGSPSVAPHLEVLDLALEGRGWKDSLDPRHWSAIATRTVRELAISIGESFVPSPETAALHPPPSHLPSVEKLLVNWIIDAPSPSILPFVALFTNLVSLELNWADTDGDVPLLLRTLPSPIRLRNLALATQIDNWDLSTVLPLFINLECHNVPGGYNTHDPSFYAALGNLPELEILKLCGPDILIDDARLGPFWDVDEQAWTPHLYSLELPDLEEFSLAGWGRLANAAADAGVVLDGTTEEAMGVVKSLHEEEEIVKERWGEHPPPSSPEELAYFTTRSELKYP
ncbi:hypothetical protein JCM8547_004884 [Rhodosporidiobolus lusitaniae]